MAVKPIPDGYHSITPYLIVRGAADAIEWYKKALGAVEIMRMPGPGGIIVHAEVRVGDSVVMLADESPAAGWKSPQTLGGCPGGIFLFTEDCDKVYQDAIAAGASSQQAPADMFWGDRYGRFTDPFGHTWSVATHQEDVSEEEMMRRQQEFMAKMTQGG